MSDPSLDCEKVLEACANLKSAPWLDFFSCFHQEITKTVLRQTSKWCRATPEIVEDLVQETYFRLADPARQIIASFRPRGPGSAKAFIHTIAKHIVIDFFKSQFTEKHGAGITVPTTEETDAVVHQGASGTQDYLDRQVLLNQIDQCLQALEKNATAERDRRIFWYYYRIGMSAREIAELPDIALGAKGVETVILRLTRLVREWMVEKTMRTGTSR